MTPERKVENMSDKSIPSTTTPDLISTWGVNLEAAVCEQCDWSYLLPAGQPPLYCPHCFQAALTPLAQQVAYLPYTRPPELVLPFTVSAEKLGQAIQDFAHQIWFAPGDLKPQNLQARLQRLYLPLWLVDSEAQATWEAEAGFNYDVVSHQDKFDDNKGGWTSQQITETRVRWEPRLGRLTRPYANIAAPALEEYIALQQKLGQYDLPAARPYQAGVITAAVVRLPNRLPADAWPDAIPVIQAAAAEECRQACQSDHLRQFRWQAAYNNLNWTLLLLPAYAAYYLDDENRPQPLLIHGQSGHVSGPRRASLKRAQRATLIIVGVAVAIFIFSLLLAALSILARSLLAVAVIGALIAIVIGLLALAPIGIAWQFNRSNVKG